MPSIINATTSTGLVSSADNSGSLQLATNNGTTAVTIDTSQNVGIGTSSPSNGLVPGLVIGNGTDNKGITLYGTTATQQNIAFTDTANSQQGLLQYDHGGDYMRFFTASTERMRITSGGDFLFGQTTYTNPPTTGADLLAGGLVINPTRRTTGSSANCNWDATSGNFARSTSSIRYKKDVADAAFGLSDVLKLRPVTYKGKSELDNDKVFAGFIAEEVDEIGLKQFVEYDSENQPDSLAYGNMVSLLTKAIQELKAELDATKAEVQALKGVA